MSRDAAIRRIVARHPPGLRAEIREKRALRYGTDPGSASGIGSHVRAGSAIRRHGSRLIVIQDVVNALAVMDASSCVVPLLLPPGADGRRSFDDTIGNKHLKMDLQSALVLPDARVLVFGSGSSRARAITDEPPPEVAAAGHDRMIVNLRPEHIAARLTPEGRSLQELQGILSDRQAPYYQHEVLAACRRSHGMDYDLGPMPTTENLSREPETASTRSSGSATLRPP